MNKFRPLLPLVMCAAILASCNDTDDIEDRLDNVEDVLGTNTPIKANFSTTDYEDAAVTKKMNFSIRPSSYDAQIYDYGDGNYNIEIYRLADVDWNEYAGIEFDYNAETKEVSDQYAEMYIRNEFGSGQSIYFNDDNSENTLEITVKSINVETGSVSITVNAESTEGYGPNIFEGHPMSMKMSFSGKIPVYLGGD
jgi:hypothetical protein